jgi:hypothetical protein
MAIGTPTGSSRSNSCKLRDGLYKVETKYLCAGFTVRNGKVVACANVLRRNIHYWVKVAKLVEEH